MTSQVFGVDPFCIDISIYWLHFKDIYCFHGWSTRNITIYLVVFLDLSFPLLVCFSRQGYHVCVCVSLLCVCVCVTHLQQCYWLNKIKSANKKQAGKHILSSMFWCQQHWWRRPAWKIKERSRCTFIRNCIRKFHFV